ncbi:Putative transcription-repair coupling factor, partial [Candidatus Arthromitus sp. SFB-3]
FPFNVDVLSRFRTTKQQKETLSKLKLGEIDIIVGTHRLLSKDVQFKNLGLLIIDEEQRFGVKHKEKIKEMKESIDVLSLSATPIPRTLHMSMVGVRDISVIDTPPEDRYPVQTFVVEYSDQLVRGAIMKEISRCGQGFFLYNSVENIDKMNIYLQNLVPECRFSVIHG